MEHPPQYISVEKLKELFIDLPINADYINEFDYSADGRLLCIYYYPLKDGRVFSENKNIAVRKLVVQIKQRPPGDFNNNEEPETPLRDGTVNQ